MAEITFFTNPMSRGQIARWALHEAGADYEAVIVDWNDKSDAFLAANPMGKVPTIIHHAAGGDRIVSEAAAICAYLAEIRPGADLLPHEDEKADYYRWLFFAAGPVEQAVTSRALKFEPAPEQQVMVGFGSYDRTMDTLEHHLAANRFVCGDRFTMADVYVGSHVDWGLHFGTFPKRDAFVAYAERCRARDAYRAGKAIDNTLIEEMSK
ncbi:glutathione S-transferase family protein [Tsuneonella sp. CC-YZS046]|uniref:glutathione S-transferase family protein n=1 Tax=Tsuneonella sp. CC-YZS046 TaxID=3042152 RepID=UPI002D767094|nr:glutathione S-transferase family protein [Tsuneonella sp. CC-YZS046]WRO65158.1 glutathione S-transferase family protein [Tsuneonella sp. CC-YZS046]